MSARSFFIVALIGLASTFVSAQEKKEKKWSLQGYIKNMSTFNFTSDSTTIDNLIHNRLNFRWFPNSEINVKVELRNRFFWGETVKAFNNYGELIDTNNDFFDLSAMAGKNSVLFHTMVDRAYFEWYKNDWELRAGRQRINWGVNLVWNPNDLFNAYSFFDFDYEERPGSDAIRIKKYTGVASSIEIASNFAEEFDGLVTAAMWKVNRWNYDFQLLAGKAREDITVGGGWAGNIKTAGFKGEVTYFYPYTGDLEESLVASISADYSFVNSLYLNGSFLYNSAAPVTPPLNESIGVFTRDRLTARDLSPFRYSTFLQVSYSFTPLINGGLSTIYYPSDRHSLFINPTVTISLKQNFDLDVIGQFYFDEWIDGYEALAKVLFVRFKWSF